MPEAGLSPQVELTVRAVEKLHLEHHEAATSADRFLDRAKAWVSRPVFVGLLLSAVLAWLMFNLMLPDSVRIDPPPFAYLSLALAVGAVCLTVLILATQWRADRLADHREKLILQLTSLSEQKTAKLIALIEELRRDLPIVRNRLDSEAQQMTQPASVLAVSEALQENLSAESDKTDNVHQRATVADSQRSRDG
jgi:uncharacterized membrane protein